MSGKFLQLRGKITHVEWLRNTAAGNPRARLTVLGQYDDTARIVETEPDAACAYGIENTEYKGIVILTLNARGKVVFIATGCPTCEHVAHRGYCSAIEMSGGASGIAQRCPCSTSTPGATS